MAQSRIERMAPLTGVVFVALLVIAALIVNNYSYLPPEDELVAFFEEGPLRLQVAAYLGAVASVFLIWFAGSVRSVLRPIEGGTGRLSAVAFAGGVAAAAVLAVAFSVLAVGGARAGSNGGIGVETAVISYDVYGSLLGLAAPVALAALTGAAAVIAFRTGGWPKWLAWASAILAVGSISPVAYIFVGIDAIWIVVVSIWLYSGTDKDSTPEPAAT